jgi:hypothetical protein
MEIRTHRNGGDASIQAVAEAWKKEAHHFHWSESEHDQWAVELAHKIHDAELQQGPAHPDPRNVHHD